MALKSSSLDSEEVLALLLRNGMIEASDVVQGLLSIDEAEGRNHNFTVSSRTGRDYFIKQSGANSGLSRTEAWVYSRVARGDWPPLARFMPRMHSADPENGLLILHRSARAHDVFELEARDERLGLPSIAGLLGSALGSLHGIPLDDETRSQLTDGPPWPLKIHRPGVHSLSEMWSAQMEVLREIQRDGAVAKQLARAANLWHRECLIHGDLKFTNVLVEVGEDREPAEVTLVDWETAAIGDAAWDLGSLFQSYLWFAVFLVSLEEDNRLVSATIDFGSRLPLFRNELSQLWSAYRDARGVLSGTGTLLDRTVVYTGVRLLQTAFELAQGEDRPGRLTSGTLQLGVNILRDPAGAARHLFALST
ncbi:MAG: phosphotransferase family protein [Gemmatimonadota bacterium]